MKFKSNKFFWLCACLFFKSLLLSEIRNAQNEVEALAFQKKRTEEQMTNALNAEKELQEKVSIL